MDRKRKKSREIFTILLDVGANSAEQLCDTDPDDLSASRQTLDWVLSRKIFTESDDEFSLILFGTNATKNDLLPDIANIDVWNRVYEPARIEWLKRLESNVLAANVEYDGDFIAALFVGLESLRVQLATGVDDAAYTSRTVTLVSNLAGVDNADAVADYLSAVVDGFHELDAQLMVIGPDLSAEPKSTSQRIGFEFITALLEQVAGCAFSFGEGLTQLKYFVPKQSQPRGQPFQLELAADFSVRLQMFIKNSEASMKFAFNPVAAAEGKNGSGGVAGAKLRKTRAYETTDEGSGGQRIPLADVDTVSDEAFRGNAPPAARTVDRANVIQGHRYGQSLIPFGVAEKSLLDYPKEGKQLQLIQFTNIKNILPQFLLSNCRYMLADQRDVDALSALVAAMLEAGVVALCRYSYNINSNPRVACLIPKVSKYGNTPVLMHYTMPFNEDLRNFEFSALERLGRVPTDYQLDVMDEFINAFDLTSSRSGGELLRCKTVLNPKHQFQCALLREKAMHPLADRLLTDAQRERLLEGVAPPKNFVKYARRIVETMKEAFPLERNPYTRVSAFADKSPSAVVANTTALSAAAEAEDLKASADFKTDSNST